MCAYGDIYQSFPEHSIKLCLSKKGKELIEKLGIKYIISVMEPIIIAKPKENISIVLHTQNQEPIHPLNDMEVDGASFIRQGIVLGYINIVPKDKNINGYTNRIALLPTSKSFEQTQEFEFIRPSSFIRNFVGKTYMSLYKRTPIIIDLYKQYKSDMALFANRFETIDSYDFFDENVKDSTKEVAGKLQNRKMWVAMHWLENGGAESWAIKQIQLAHEAGFEVYVTTDRQSPQRLHSKISKYAKVFLCSSILSHKDWLSFAINFVEKYGITDIHIHHSAVVYNVLLPLKTLYPHLKVADSTHIVEYRGGGFVSDSIAFSNLIDLHHVISPKLRDLYHDSGISKDKVLYRPLTDLSLSVGEKNTSIFDSINVNKPLRIGFIGRYSVQKRPFLFLYLAKKLLSKYPGKFEFYMQGTGELEKIIMHKARKLGVVKKINFLGWGKSKDFFEKVDVLVISSENEGLTLTSLEADFENVLVVSANVGSQETVIVKEALLSKQANKFLKQAEKLLVKISKDDNYYLDLLRKQRKLVGKVRTLESAGVFFKGYYESMKESK